jgi:hypothetical protein
VSWFGGRDDRKGSTPPTSDPEKELPPHVHYMCGCPVCSQRFELCAPAGIPCFVFCPNCRSTLTLSKG